jgi:hypothetical protein
MGFPFVCIQGRPAGAEPDSHVAKILCVIFGERGVDARDDLMLPDLVNARYGGSSQHGSKFRRVDCIAR